MPVLEHEVHEKVKEKSDARYGCHNRTSLFKRFCRSLFSGQEWPFRMSNECRYDMSISDSKCEGCKHRGSGEAYDLRIRELGK